MSRYIDEHRDRFGVEPFCRALDVSASAFHQRATGERSRRAVNDEQLLATIRELHQVNYFAYVSRRMWKALKRAGETLAAVALSGSCRRTAYTAPRAAGKAWKTTRPDSAARRRRRARPSLRQ